MEVATIEVDREEARKRVEEFTAKRRKKLTEMDQALYRGYKALAEGLKLIDVNQAIKQGGHFDENYCPKLALARSDLSRVFFEHQFRYPNGNIPLHGGEFRAWATWDSKTDEYCRHLAERGQAEGRGLHDLGAEEGLLVELEAGMIESPEDERKGRTRWYKTTFQTIVPTIPFHLRPNGDANKYFILWEVEKWEEFRPARAPGDPLLLERIAHPVYVVVAQWDLSELEKRILESFRR